MRGTPGWHDGGVTEGKMEVPRAREYRTVSPVGISRRRST
jgi:hypothetical protein